MEDASPEVLAALHVLVGEGLFAGEQLVDFLLAAVVRGPLDELQRAAFQRGFGELEGVRADEEPGAVDEVRGAELARPLDRLARDAEGAEPARAIRRDNHFPGV